MPAVAGLIDGHPVGHVPGDGHAEPVRLGADRLDQRRRDQAVDLDLLKSGVVVLADRLLRFVGRRGISRRRTRSALVRRRARRAADEDRGRASTRWRRAAGDELELVPHVADGRHP